MPKAVQTKHHVVVVWGAARRAWPSQRLGPATKCQVSAAPVGLPPAWRLGPAGCNLTMPHPNSAVQSKSTHNL